MTSLLTTLRGAYQQLGTPALAMLAAFILAFLVFVWGSSMRKRALERPFFKPILTKREEAMFERLVKAFPNHSILAQISFGALLGARTRGARNRFDRKIADFAICDKYTAKVRVLIELDDASHRGKEKQDAARDRMLTRAGYVVRRYPNIPNISALQTDMRSLLRG